MNALQTLSTSLKTAGNTTKAFFKTNSSNICAGGAIIGVGITIIETYKAAPKSVNAIEEAKEKKGEDLTVLEKFAAGAPSMIRPVIAGTATTALILASKRIDHNTIIGLTAAAGLSERRLEELDTKMTDILGEKQANEIKHEIAKDKIDEASKNWTQFYPDDAKFLWVDELTGHTFMASTADVTSWIAVINANMAWGDTVPRSEFAWRAGIPTSGVEEVAYWDASQGRIEYTIEYDRAPNGHPAAVLTFTNLQFR